MLINMINLVQTKYESHTHHFGWLFILKHFQNIPICKLKNNHLKKDLKMHHIILLCKDVFKKTPQNMLCLQNFPKNKIFYNA